jgi:hypothetical protein
VKTSLIAFTCGYVEDSLGSVILFKSDGVFETGAEALEDLALGCSLGRS